MLEKLYARLKSLRDPENGCPWDKAQTWESLKSPLLEECYELFYAVDNGDIENLKEELGDLYLVLSMITLIAEERKEFSLSEVLEGIEQKIVRRHPHVFGDSKAENIDEVKRIWQAEKDKEGAKKEGDLTPTEDDFKDLSRSEYEQLLQARKIIQKMDKRGFNWDSVEQVYEKIDEELQEIRESQKSEDNHAHLEEEIGDALFSIVNLAYELDVEPTIALERTNRKVKNRFNLVLKEAGYFEGKPLTRDKKILNQYWEEAKEHLERVDRQGKK